VQVKAQGLLNAAKYIEEEYGRDALGEVVRACSGPVRERYMSAIAINWHPVEEFIEFVETADKKLGRGNLKLAEEVGAAGARANMKGTVVRIAVYIAKPEYFLRRVAGLWRQFNDEGEMLVHDLGERSGTLEVRGLTKPNAVFCAVLTGWAREIARGIGIQNPHTRHSECRARGGTRCLWDVRWSAIETSGSDERLVAAARPQTVPPPASGPQAAKPPSSKALRVAPAARGMPKTPSKPPPKDKSGGGDR
jgi:hypothetical protein